MDLPRVFTIGQSTVMEFDTAAGGAEEILMNRICLETELRVCERSEYS